MVAEQLDIYIGQTKILTQYIHSKTIYTLTGGQLGGVEERLPLPFWKIEKGVLILEGDCFNDCP